MDNRNDKARTLDTHPTKKFQEIQPIRPNLKVALPHHAILLALIDNLFTNPLSSERPVEHIELRNDILAALLDSSLRSDRPIRSNTQLNKRRQRVRKLVGRELDVLVLVETLGDQVAERMVFLVEGEELGIGDT